MILYSSTKKNFINDVLSGEADAMIESSFVREMGYRPNQGLVRTFKNSMPYMGMVLSDPDIPDTSGVAVEYKIPQTSKRIDFILTGLGQDNTKTAVIIELKQWEKAELTDMDGIVKTFVGKGNRETSHPSYQVWAYSTLLEDYNSNVQDESIEIKPCAYLHNYEEDKVIKNSFYSEYTKKAPVFLKKDALELRKFIKKFVKYGDNREVLFFIEKGKIKPSKSLAESLSSMLQGNKEFTLIDDQKIVYETALKLAKKSSSKNKNVLIVEGGPGTGKSVVAINLLSRITDCGQLAQYVTKNSAPRKVYQVKLTGKFTQTRIANLFTSSGSFYDVEKDRFDALIVDEAHRINMKSGLFSHLGQNQAKEIIDASKFSVFFLDEDQRVTLQDVGEKLFIEKIAKSLGAKVHHLKLSSQFRCNGSDGYLAWVDNMLQIRGTANDSITDLGFDFRVFDNPEELHKEILNKNAILNKARMVAGYCWNWVSKNNIRLKDIVIENYGAKWNLSSYGQAWIIHPDSAGEVGCIHTCQGLELDYVGVILGEDLIVRNGKVITDFNKRAKTDQSLKGIKKIFKENPHKALEISDKIIKNTYRTLMTRGMKGCYIYSVDKETQEYFREKLKKKFSYNDVSDEESFIKD